MNGNKSHSRRTILTVMVGAICLFLLVLARAEPPNQPALLSDKERRPTADRISIAEIPLLGGDRVVAIEKGLAGGAKYVYPHRPVFAFHERLEDKKDKQSNIPAIIQDLEPLGKGDEVDVLFKIASSSPEFRVKCKEVLLVKFRSEEGQGMPLVHPIEATEVVRYPLLHVFAKCRQGRETLAVGESSRLDDAGDDFELKMTFSKVNFEKFKTGQAKGKNIFEFSYLYTGAKSSQATGYVTVQRAIVQEIQRSLESRNSKPDAPLFQSDYNAVVQRLQGTVTRTVLANDKDAARMLQEKTLDQIIATIFARDNVSLETLEGTTDRALQDGFRSFIKALEQTEKTQRHTDEEWRKLEEDRKKRTQKNELSGGLKLGIPLGKGATLGIDLSASTSNENESETRKELERKYGLTTTYDKETKTFNARQIIIRRLSASSQDLSFSMIDSIFIASETHNSYVPATPVRGTFLYRHLLDEPSPPKNIATLRHRLQLAIGELADKGKLLEEKRREAIVAQGKIASQAARLPEANGPAESAKVTQAIIDLAKQLQTLDNEIKRLSEEVTRLQKAVTMLKGNIGT